MYEWLIKSCKTKFYLVYILLMLSIKEHRNCYQRIKCPFFNTVFPFKENSYNYLNAFHLKMKKLCKKNHKQCMSEEKTTVKWLINQKINWLNTIFVENQNSTKIQCIMNKHTGISCWCTTKNKASICYCVSSQLKTTQNVM